VLRLSSLEAASVPEVKQPSRRRNRFQGMDYHGPQPVVANDALVLAAGDAVSRTDLRTGTESWRFNLDLAATPGLEFAPSVVSNGLVVIATNQGHLMALDERDGLPVWGYRFRGTSFSSRPVARDDRLCITTDDGRILVMPLGAREAMARLAEQRSNPPGEDSRLPTDTVEAIRAIFERRRGPADSSLPPDPSGGIRGPNGENIELPTRRNAEPAPQPEPPPPAKSRGQEDRERERREARQAERARR
jgi:hypothetical protein